MVAPVETARRRPWSIVLVALLAAALLAACYATPLRAWFEPARLERFFRSLASSAWAPLIVSGVFVAGGLLLVPVTLMVVATTAAFGAWLGGLYAMAGALLSAGLGYAIGFALGRDRVRRLFGGRLAKLGNRLSQQGVLVVTVIRLLPLAPYTVVNLAAGAAQIRLRDFLVGTTIGMLPGIVGAALFAEQLVRTIQRPDPGNVLLLVAVLVLLVLVARWVERRLTGPPPRGDEHTPHGPYGTPAASLRS
jgi:phospholipase D1/2